MSYACWQGTSFKCISLLVPTTRTLEVECYRRANGTQGSSVQCIITDKYYPLTSNFRPICQQTGIREVGPFFAFSCPDTGTGTDIWMIAGLCYVFIGLEHSWTHLFNQEVNALPDDVHYSRRSRPITTQNQAREFRS